MACRRLRKWSDRNLAWGMAKKAHRVNSTEFPILDDLKLYASLTTGDGNCLFRALSDQVYGDESRHSEIRSKVVDHVRTHKNHFEAFVGEFGETFDQYICRLAQDGVYGGHIELVGFASVYFKQVVIYQSESLYIVQPLNSDPDRWKGSVHVAYHSWEHYSSVRQVGGPRSGPVDLAIPLNEKWSGNRDQDKCDFEEPKIQQWKIDIVLKSVPDASEEQVIEMLKTKDYDMIIEELLMSDEVCEKNEAHSTIDSNEKGFKSPETCHDEPSMKSKNNAKDRKAAARRSRKEKKEWVHAKKHKAKTDIHNEIAVENSTKTELLKIVHI